MSVFAAGPYALTWDSLPIGLMRGDQQSPAIRFQHKGQRIDSTNAFGSSLVDWIYLGRDAFLNAVLMEWDTVNGVVMMFPFGTGFGQVGIIGQSAAALAQAAILTCATGSLAHTAGPVTITAAKAILAPDFNIDQTFGPVLRETPISLALLASVVSSNLVNLTYA